MARKGITYDQVAEAIATLVSEQHKITVRAIQARTGGSMSTVLKHYRRWQCEQSGVVAEVPEISPRLAEALHDELRSHARRSLQGLEHRLQSERKERQQVEDRLGALQRELERAEEQIGVLHDQVASLEALLQDAEARAVQTEAQRQKPRQRKTAHASARTAQPDTPPRPTDTPDEHQGAFKF